MDIVEYVDLSGTCHFQSCLITIISIVYCNMLNKLIIIMIWSMVLKVFHRVKIIVCSICVVSYSINTPFMLSTDDSINHDIWLVADTEFFF